MFDRYWNSDSAWPAALLLLPPLQDRVAARAALAARLRPGTSRVVSDEPGDGGIRHAMMGTTFELADGAQRELLVWCSWPFPRSCTERPQGWAASSPPPRGQ